MTWPTSAEVEAAERDVLREWANNLPRATNDEQVAISARVCVRMVQLSPYERPRHLPMPERPAETPQAAPVAKPKTKPKPKAAPVPEASERDETGSLFFLRGLRA